MIEVLEMVGVVDGSGNYLKQGEPADPKAKRSAQPGKNKQTHISRPKRSISPLQASWQMQMTFLFNFLA